MLTRVVPIQTTRLAALFPKEQALNDAISLIENIVDLVNSDAMQLSGTRLKEFIGDNRTSDEQTLLQTIKQLRSLVNNIDNNFSEQTRKNLGDFTTTIITHLQSKHNWKTVYTSEFLKIQKSLYKAKALSAKNSLFSPEFTAKLSTILLKSLSAQVDKLKAVDPILGDEVAYAFSQNSDKTRAFARDYLEKVVFSKPQDSWLKGADPNDPTTFDKARHNIEKKVGFHFLDFFQELQTELENQAILSEYQLQALVDASTPKAQKHDMKSAQVLGTYIRRVTDQILTSLVSEIVADAKERQLSNGNTITEYDHYESQKSRIAKAVESAVRDYFENLESQGLPPASILNELTPSTQRYWTMILNARQELGFLEQDEIEDRQAEIENDYNEYSVNRHQIKLEQEKIINRIKTFISDMKGALSGQDKSTLTIGAQKDLTQDLRNALLADLRPYVYSATNTENALIPKEVWDPMERLVEDYPIDYVVSMLTQWISGHDASKMLLFKAVSVSLNHLSILGEDGEVLYEIGLTEAELMKMIADYFKKEENKKEYYTMDFMGHVFLVPKYTFSLEKRVPLIEAYVARVKHNKTGSDATDFQRKVDNHKKSGGWGAVEKYLKTWYSMKLPALITPGSLATYEALTPEEVKTLNALGDKRSTKQRLKDQERQDRRDVESVVETLLMATTTQDKNISSNLKEYQKKINLPGVERSKYLKLRDSLIDILLKEKQFKVSDKEDSLTVRLLSNPQGYSDLEKLVSDSSIKKAARIYIDAQTSKQERLEQLKLVAEELQDQLDVRRDQLTSDEVSSLRTQLKGAFKLIKELEKDIKRSQKETDKVIKNLSSAQKNVLENLSGFQSMLRTRVYPTIKDEQVERVFKSALEKVVLNTITQAYSNPDLFQDRGAPSKQELSQIAQPLVSSFISSLSPEHNKVTRSVLKAINKELAKSKQVNEKRLDELINKSYRKDLDDLETKLLDLVLNPVEDVEELSPEQATEETPVEELEQKFEEELEEKAEPLSEEQRESIDLVYDFYAQAEKPLHKLYQENKIQDNQFEEILQNTLQPVIEQLIGIIETKNLSVDDTKDLIQQPEYSRLLDSDYFLELAQNIQVDQEEEQEDRSVEAPKQEKAQEPTIPNGEKVLLLPQAVNGQIVLKENKSANSPLYRIENKIYVNQDLNFSTSLIGQTYLRNYFQLSPELKVSGRYKTVTPTIVDNNGNVVTIGKIEPEKAYNDEDVYLVPTLLGEIVQELPEQDRSSFFKNYSGPVQDYLKQGKDPNWIKETLVEQLSSSPKSSKPDFLNRVEKKVFDSDSSPEQVQKLVGEVLEEFPIQKEHKDGWIEFLVEYVLRLLEDRDEELSREDLVALIRQEFERNTNQSLEDYQNQQAPSEDIENEMKVLVNELTNQYLRSMTSWKSYATLSEQQRELLRENLLIEIQEKVELARVALENQSESVDSSHLMAQIYQGIFTMDKLKAWYADWYQSLPRSKQASRLIPTRSRLVPIFS